MSERGRDCAERAKKLLLEHNIAAGDMEAMIKEKKYTRVETARMFHPT